MPRLPPELTIDGSLQPRPGHPQTATSRVAGKQGIHHDNRTEVTIRKKRTASEPSERRKSRYMPHCSNNLYC